MAMHFSRNVIIPLWFATFALVAFLMPRSAFGWSLLLLALGLTVPVMVYVVWQDRPLQRVSTVRPRTDAQRTT
jgi:hypothetical protein